MRQAMQAQKVKDEQMGGASQVGGGALIQQSPTPGYTPPLSTPTSPVATNSVFNMNSILGYQSGGVVVGAATPGSPGEQHSASKRKADSVTSGT